MTYTVFIIVFILVACFAIGAVILSVVRGTTHFGNDKFKLYQFRMRALVGILFLWSTVATALCFTPGDVLLTKQVVAHTMKTNLNYKVVYVDEKEDISYVVPTNNSGIDVGDEVLLSNGAVDEIIELLPEGFRIANKDSTVAAGMSGTPVLRDGKTIGLISSYYADGSVYCIWY